MDVKRAVIWLVVFAGVMRVARAAVTVTPVGEFPLPGLQPGQEGPPGLSGLTRVGGDTYFSVCDKGGTLHQMTIRVDRASGAVTGCVFGLSVKLEGKGKLDFESVAWDDANRWVWVGDELDGSIRAFLPVTGRRVKELDVPAVYGAFRFNRSFESLSIRANGLEMWTCNEDALCRSDAVNKKGPPVDDGPRATREHGSTVRIQKFMRSAPNAGWMPSGQWAYRVDPIGGRNFAGKARSGVAEMCCLDDGTVLVLEREMSVKGGVLIPVPSFRCRIYQVDFAGATDVSGMMALNGAEFRPVSKTPVFDQNTGFAMYEGMCLGPLLADGSRSLLMISDAGAGAMARLYALKVSSPPSPQM
ncbi:MAG: esterase-like activity of phytase family protein [Kiritimatiellae bacterium]|nr:esterase-like activity of phytase family protein [Kiritimatiellia bacterium]